MADAGAQIADMSTVVDNPLTVTPAALAAPPTSGGNGTPAATPAALTDVVTPAAPRPVDSKLVSLGRVPIPGGQPCGENARYDDDYARVENELRKLDALTGEKPDWQVVIDAGSALLEKRTKDLTIAGYVCLALVQRRGYAGLAEGLALCHRLIETFWEGMYPELPKRLKARSNAVTLLNDRVAPLVANKAPESGTADHLRRCVDELERLNQLCGEKFSEQRPVLGELRKALRDQLSHAAPPPPAAAVATASRTAAPAAQGAAVDLASRNAAVSSLTKVAAYLRQTDAADPLGYQLSRLARWDGMTLPPHQNGKTRIPSPDKQRRDALAKQCENASWNTLLDAAESIFGEAVLWLDLQRYVDRSLGGLGERFGAARQAVRVEVRNVLQRIPELKELQFNDGSPLADGPTKMWIDAEVLAAAGDGSAQRSSTGASGDGQLDAVVAEARKLAVGGDLTKAVAMLEERIAATARTRARFVLRLRLAQLCLTAGQAPIGASMMMTLDEEGQRMALDEWEPELALEIVRGLYGHYRQSMTNAKEAAPHAADQCRRLLARLCRLDATAALSMK